MRSKSFFNAAVVFMLALVFFAANPVDAGPRRDKASAKHKAECEAWCRQHPDCVKCSKLGDCGPGYKDIKSWTGFGENWHACAKRISRQEASRKNKSACRRWCNEHSEEGCEFCSEKAACGKGYKSIKSFRGKGDNWFACKKTKFGQSGRALDAKHKRQCETFCKNEQSCEKCSELPGCGPGYASIASFNGPGKNWYACKRNVHGKYSEENQDECRAYCSQNKRCKKCSKKPGCGPGFKPMASFKGRGKNWYACEKR